MRPVATSCFRHDSSYVPKPHSEMASSSKGEWLNKVIQSCLEFLTVILTLVEGIIHCFFVFFCHCKCSKVNTKYVKQKSHWLHPPIKFENPGKWRNLTNAAKTKDCYSTKKNLIDWMLNWLYFLKYALCSLWLFVLHMYLLSKLWDTTLRIAYLICVMWECFVVDF